MEIDVSSPGSPGDETSVIVPGLDIYSASSPVPSPPPSPPFGEASHEPVTGLQSPFTPADSPFSADGGPVTPGADLNEDEEEVEAVPGRTINDHPVGEYEKEASKSPSIESEEFENRVQTPESPLPSESPVEMDQGEDGSRSPNMESDEDLDAQVQTPGSPSPEATGSLESNDQAPTPGSPLQDEGPPKSLDEESAEYVGQAMTPSSPPITEDTAGQNEAEVRSPNEGSGEEFEAQVHTPGSPNPDEEESSKSVEKDNFTGTQEGDNDNTAISYAFLSSQGEGMAESGGIPFLGDSTVPEPSPKPMQEEIVEEVVSTSMDGLAEDSENVEENKEQGGDTAQDEAMEEDAGISSQVVIPFLGDSTIPESSPEAVEEVVEEVVATSTEEVVEEKVADEPAEAAQSEEEVSQVEKEKEEAIIQETGETEVEAVEEEKDEGQPSKPDQSPEQVVEEVFLSTEASRKQASDESDFEGFDANEAASPSPARNKRKRRLILEDDEEEEGEAEKPTKPVVQDDEESDFEGFEPEEEKKGDRQDLIADIFGQSDDEGEFEGFAEAEVQPVKDVEEVEKKEEDGKESEEIETMKKKKDDGSSSSSEDEGVAPDGMPSFSSDFEEMMMRRKEEMRKRRRGRRGDIDIINNSDDLVVQLISDMKIAAKMDRDLILMRQPAIQKLRMLPQVESMLRKSDMQLSLIDCGVLSAITEWLSPLPDRSLPALSIRTNLLQALTLLPGIGADNLKESGVGKAVMYLHKHPKETSGNRRIAGKLVYNWSRPIFDLTSDYKSLSKEARQKRDMDNLPKKRRISADADATPRRDIDKEMSAESKPLRPGDPGWVARARVPMPSNKDYVYRPRSKLENAASGGAPKKASRFEKHLRKIKDIKTKGGKLQKAVSMSLQGRKMAL